MPRKSLALALRLAGLACSFSAAAVATPCHSAGRLPSDAIVASWYGREHRGHVMADGTRFDEHGLTAAPPSLPLKTRVKVTNLANGATVNVTITDRGPGYGRGI